MSEKKQNLSVFPRGEELVGKGAENFCGKAYAARLESKEASITHVVFEPGCRNNWHIHHGSGQTLLVTGGNGWYQEWGKPAQRVKPGDVVDIPEGVKHWHGACKDCWFSHLAVKANTEEGRCEWLEPVDEKSYENL